MKKLKFVTLTLAVSCAVASATAAEDRFSGAYVGLSFAKSTFKSKLHKNNSLNSAFTDFNPSSAGIFAGYRFVTNNNIVGFVEASYGTYFTSDSSFTGENKKPVYIAYKNVSDYGLAVGVGYRFDHVLPYLKVGAYHYNNELKTTSSDAQTISNVKNSVFGPSFGLGVKYSVLEHVEIGAEYQVSFFDEQKQTDAKVDTTQHRFSLNVAYRF